MSFQFDQQIGLSGATTPGQSKKQWKWRGNPDSPTLQSWSLAIGMFNVLSRGLVCEGLRSLQRCSRYILQLRLSEINHLIYGPYFTAGHLQFPYSRFDVFFVLPFFSYSLMGSDNSSCSYCIFIYGQNHQPLWLNGGRACKSMMERSTSRVESFPLIYSNFCIYFFFFFNGHLPETSDQDRSLRLTSCSTVVYHSR